LIFFKGRSSFFLAKEKILKGRGLGGFEKRRGPKFFVEEEERALPFSFEGKGSLKGRRRPVCNFSSSCGRREAPKGYFFPSFFSPGGSGER